MRKPTEKLLKYLQNDRFKKFKSYVEKHAVILRKIRLENGDSLLHEACRSGKGYFVRYLLDSGVNPLAQNDQGEVPLHLACHAVVTHGMKVMEEAVRPLMKKCIAAAEVSDRMGRKPRDLLREIHETINSDQDDHDQAAEKRHERVAEAEEDNEDERWKRRLAEEMNDEYGEQWGNYENDYCEVEKEPDTFDNWAESLHRQRREKRHRHYLTFEEERERMRNKSKLKEEETRRKMEDMEREHQKYLARAKGKEKDKLKRQKERYTRKMKKFYQVDRSKGHEITYSDVPWPHLRTEKPLDKMKDFLLCDIDASDAIKVKKYLKEQQIIWHPDRFLQRCGEYLLPSDKDKIMLKVNMISQQLNAYVTEIK